MRLPATILFCLSITVLLTGCPSDQKSPPDRENPSLTPPRHTQTPPANPQRNNPSEKERVDQLRRAQPNQEPEDPFSQAVRRIDELAGQIGFDSSGNLIAVDLASGRISATDQDVQLLAAFPHLKKLKLSGQQLTNHSTKIIAGITNLTELALENTQIDDEGLRQLAQLPKLASLNVRRSNNLSDRALGSLKDFPSLVYLYLLDNNFTKTGIASLEDVPQLRLLDLRGCARIDQSALEHLPALKNLQCLKLGGQTIGDGSLAVLARMEGLKDLAVEDSPITNAGLAHIRGLPLESLTIFRCYGIDDRGLVHLEDFVDLQRLSLRDTPVNGTGLVHIAGKRKLRSLELSETGIDDAALQHLADLTALQRLGLRQTMISDAGLEIVAKLVNLKHLDLEDDGITDTGTAHLESLAAIEHLNLKLNARVTDRSIERLSRLVNLKTLNLAQTGVTEKGVAQLEVELPLCKLLK